MPKLLCTPVSPPNTYSLVVTANAYLAFYIMLPHVNIVNIV